ncbi:hypothetical protein FKZ61_001790 [Litorilinea aerophila]|uniref:Uncharacterized protein n=1 Tax=Litorilinea aerophila TaxID=1204385 RepID=A0A540VLJ4_9CHLR|nr:hypothetical protein [Litorilinea aerophila]MCC9074849.1 hypothetical protein [Litorilinea aerophila]
MCQQMWMLAEQSHTRYVSQCEHGTVHLVWDGVSVHLAPEAFARLSGHLLRLAAQAEAQVAGAGVVEAGQCRLQIGSLSVGIPLQELASMAALVATAASSLAGDRPATRPLSALPLWQGEIRWYCN